MTKLLIFTICKYEKSDDPLYLNKDFLTLLHKKYANLCGADYKVVRPGKDFDLFCEWLKDCNLFDDEYQAIQHYKHKLMKDFSADYDKILYLDLDVMTVSNISIFDKFHWNNSAFVHGFEDDLISNIISLERHGLLSYIPNPRSISVKKALMIEMCKKANKPRMIFNHVYNTGIMLMPKDIIRQIDYVSNLVECHKLINIIKNDKNNFYADFIVDKFSSNNESIFSYLIYINDIKIDDIGEKWHFRFNHRNQHEEVPKDVEFIHVINKKFTELISRYIDDEI